MRAYEVRAHTLVDHPGVIQQSSDTTILTIAGSLTTALTKVQKEKVIGWQIDGRDGAMADFYWSTSATLAAAQRHKNPDNQPFSLPVGIDGLNKIYVRAVDDVDINFILTIFYSDDRQDIGVT